MITTTHIQQIEGIEGEFLFIIDSDINPALDAYKSALSSSTVKRKFNFIATPNSNQWNKIRDLANNVVNYFESESSVRKGAIINELTSASIEKLCLVFIDSGDENSYNDILNKISSKLSNNAKVILKCVDTLPILDYINNNNIIKPTLLSSGYVSFTNKKKALVLGEKVSKEVSNNF